MKARFKFPLLKIIVAIGPDLREVVFDSIVARNNDVADAAPVEKKPFRVWVVALSAVQKARSIAFQVAAAKADGVVDESEIAEIASAVAVAVAVPLAEELSRSHGSQITADEWEIIAADAATRLVPKIAVVLKEANDNVSATAGSRR